MRGIRSYAAYIPYRRLERSDIASVFGGAPGRGRRTVASFDEDTTTMGFEAARLALRSVGGSSPDALWFATAEPAYVEKTNATAIHAALRLDPAVAVMDINGAVRSGVGAFLAASRGIDEVLVTVAGMRSGLPMSADEAEGGDGAAALLMGNDSDGPVIAEYLGGASETEEFVDRWRTPGSPRPRQWEARFGETVYVPMAERAWNAALKACELNPGQIDIAVVTGTHARAVRAAAGRLGAKSVANNLDAVVGNTGAAHFGVVLADVLDKAEPDTTIAVVVLADGADVLLFRTTDAIASFVRPKSVGHQIARSAPISYGKFLAWRNMVDLEPPNRPTPNRPSSSAAARSTDWKYGFVGSRDRQTGIVHLPPQRVGIYGGTTDDMEPAPESETLATVATFTVDRLIYSESPPVIFAVLDFDGGGRFPCQLTDCDVDDVEVGTRVEMTFRRLFTADGIHNYFWKARPIGAKELP
ncbi:MAG TPA: OB-fold domain-containing protein [Acidimicrobiales bacterium]|nr:OB-fold domain-containing protein [Acidimicrobiales bacterium]